MAKLDFKVNAVTKDGEAVQIRPDQVDKARDRGWSIEGVPFRKPSDQGGAEAVTVQPTEKTPTWEGIVDKAIANGWSLEGDAEEGVPESIAAPEPDGAFDMRADVPAAAPAEHDMRGDIGGAPPVVDSPAGVAGGSDKWSVNFTSAGIGDQQQRITDAAEQLRQQEEIAAAQQREAKQDRAGVNVFGGHGANVFTGAGASRLTQLAGDNLAKGSTLGFEAPAAIVETLGKDAVDQFYSPRDQANTYVDVVPVDQVRGQAMAADTWVPDAIEPYVPTTAGVRPDVVADMQERAEANPTAAAGFQIAGMALPLLATGGAAAGAEGAVAAAAPGVARIAQTAVKAAPAGWLAHAASKLGVKAAGLVPGAGTATLEAPGLYGALARVGATGVKLATEGAAEGGAQQAASAVNDAWLNNDAQTAWEYATAGAGGLAEGAGVGAVLGLSAGLGLSGGAEVGRKIGVLADDAPQRLARAIGLSSDAKALSEPLSPEAREGAGASFLRKTPEQAEKLRLGSLRKVESRLNEFNDLTKRIEIDPTQPVPPTPKQLEELRGKNYQQAQSDLDEFVDLARKAESDPAAPRPLPAHEYEAVQEKTFTTLKNDLNDFVETKRRLQVEAEPPKKTPKQLQTEADDLYRGTKDDLNKLIGLGNKLDNTLGLRDKAEWVRKVGDQPWGAGKWSKEQLRDIVGVPDDFLAGLENHNAVKFEPSDVRSVAVLRDKIDAQIDDLVRIQGERQLTVGDVFNALDQAKRDAGKAVSRANKRNEWLFNRLEPRVGSLRTGMLNEGGLGNAEANVWPDALVDMQKRTNEKWAPAIAADQDSTLKHAFGNEGTQAEWNHWESPERINDTWLTSHMKKLGTPQGETEREAMLRYIDTHADDWATRAEVYGSPESKKAAAEYVETAKRVRAKLADAEAVNVAARDTFDPIGAAASSTKDSSLSGMLGREGKYDPEAPMSAPEKVQDSWLRNHLVSRGTPYEQQTAAALDRFLSEQASEAAEYAKRVGTTKAAADAAKIEALRDKARTELANIERVNASQKSPPPQWDAAVAAESDSALSGMLGKAGTGPSPDDMPVRINADWLNAHLGKLGDPAAAQRAEAFERWLDARVQKATDMAYTLGSEERAREAIRLVELRGQVRARTEESLKLNAMMNPPDAPLTPAAASRMDASVRSLFAKSGDIKDYRPGDIGERVNSTSLDSMLKSLGDVRQEQAEIAMLRYINANADQAMEIARSRGTKEAAEMAERIHNLRRELKNDIDQAARNNMSIRKAGGKASDLGFLNVGPAAYEKVRDAFASFMHRNSIKTLERVDTAAQLQSLVSKAPKSTAARVSSKAVSELGDDVDRFIDELFDDSEEKREQQNMDRQEIERIIGPEVAMASAQQFETRRNWLIQKAGGPPSDPAARLKMQRYAPAVMEPLSAVERLANGTASNEDREALAELTPGIYKRFVEQASKTAARKNLSYDQRLKVSRAIGLPVEPTLNPDRLAQLQNLASSNPANQQQQADESGGTLAPSRQRPPDLASIVER